MNSKIWIAIVLFTSVLFSAEVVGTKTLKVDRGLTVEGAKCVECHSRETPGHVNDWKDSRHGHVGVSCIDCHSVNADSPMAAQNCPGVKGTETFVTPLVSSNKCSQCHPAEADQFAHSGHVRGRTQIEGKAGMMALMDKVEGRNHPQFQKSVDITGCGQ